MIVRPPEYLDDVRERELEMQAAEARLPQLDYQLCPHCDYEVERDFLRCPSCMRKLKEPCRELRQAARPDVDASARTARPRSPRSTPRERAGAGGGADATTAQPRERARPSRAVERRARARREPIAEPTALRASAAASARPDRRPRRWTGP